MKILMVNKFYYRKGGSETYYFALKELLESHGHTVIDFSMQDDKNYGSAYEGYFVENVDYNANNGIAAKIHMAMNIIYSKEAKRKFEKLVLATKPDVIHLHIFQHQISPSILDVIKKYQIPTVYTAHDLKMICLNYKMFHHNQICEACKDGKIYKCLFRKCVKDSYVKSLINVLEGYVHKIKKSYDVISLIITPSLFYKKKFEEFGIDSDRVVHIPNFIMQKENVCPDFSRIGNSYVWLGRLSEEKGIWTLVKAFADTGISLEIIGTGPLENDLRNYVEIGKYTNVHVHGYKSGEELQNIVKNAKAIVITSEWYENGPYSVIEALQMGKPIVAANIGGIPEMIRDNGILFESGNDLSLKQAVSAMEKKNRIELQKFGWESYKLFRENYTEDVHYEMLKEAYKKIGVQI